MSQFAGARWGESAIPQTWRAKLALGDKIVTFADALLDLDPTG